MKQPVFYSLDLEMEQPSNEIISVGVAYNNSNGAIARENFLITPTNPISKKIQGLTGLKDEMFDTNKTRQECFAEFADFHDTFMENVIAHGDKFHREAVVWGVGDIPLLRKQMHKENVRHTINNRFIDVKTLVMMDRLVNGKSISQRMSLKSGLSEYKLLFRGDAHNSSWDAYNTLVLFNTYIAKQKQIVNALNIIKQL